MKTEERTEWVSMRVTPSIKKEFERLGDDDKMKEFIIKNLFETEKNWLESEMKEMDDATLKQSVKLLTIKENFSKAQDSYVQEIEKISSEADKTFKKLDSVAESLNNKMKIANESLSRIYGNIKSINLYDIERLIGLLDKYNSMSEKEKELMKILLSTQLAFGYR